MACKPEKTMKQPHFSYRTYTFWIPLLAAIGLFASLYLGLSHYRNYTDMSYSSFCAISKAINCDTVSQSSWSILLGIPLALWGVFAYTLVFIISLPAQINTKERRYLWDLLFFLALLFSLADVYFGYIKIFKIHAYCLVCLLSYGVSLGLLFSTWIIRRRFNNHSLIKGLIESLSFLKKDKLLVISTLVLLFLFGSLKIYIPTYWIFEYPALKNNIQTGITEDGRQWIGAVQPSIVIKEFTDYQCFQCSKMHLILRQLVNEHPDTVRLIHYHYPMDDKFNTVLVKDPFHTGSGALALLAIAAGKQDKYWQANDALYSIARQGIEEFNINKFAKKLHVDSEQLKRDMYSQSTLKELESDIRTGLKNQIIGTPSFIVNGHVYAGHLPPTVFNEISK